VTYGKLFFPTKAADHDSIDSLAKATMVANRVLQDNGMADFATHESRVTLWNGIYLFGYDNLHRPELKTGGGASLVVRASDFLGGMVHVPPDWLEQDRDKLLAPVLQAFTNHDNSQAANR
jgi:hypothetical protein